LSKAFSSHLFLRTKGKAVTMSCAVLSLKCTSLEEGNNSGKQQCFRHDGPLELPGTASMVEPKLVLFRLPDPSPKSAARTMYTKSV
jgi:hypothetical protein